MSGDVKRSSRRFEGQTKVTYKTALYHCDDGMWTVIEITEKPILMTASETEALALIRRLSGPGQ